MKKTLSCDFPDMQLDNIVASAMGCNASDLTADEVCDDEMFIDGLLHVELSLLAS